MEVLTQRAAEPCQQVMMLSTTMRTGGPSSFFDSIPFGEGMSCCFLPGMCKPVAGLTGGKHLPEGQITSQRCPG